MDDLLERKQEINRLALIARKTKNVFSVDTYPSPINDKEPVLCVEMTVEINKVLLEVCRLFYSLVYNNKNEIVHRSCIYMILTTKSIEIKVCEGSDNGHFYFDIGRGFNGKTTLLYSIKEFGLDVKVITKIVEGVFKILNQGD